MLFSLLLACSTKGTTVIDQDTALPESPPPAAADCPEETENAVMTSHGCVLGTTSLGLEYFLNIPYAEPPIDELRWKRPVSAKVWETPLQADRAGNYCVQFGQNGVVGDEDCLNLNIIRPLEAEGPLPILFFTHGGSSTNGSGHQDIYIGNPQLATDAIVVTYNYRLGALGFLAHPDLTDEDAEEQGGRGTSGNQGLFDTLMALQWVVDNAEAFGGDPDQLMIFGESAGGIGTCALLVSPLAEGLFSSALIQSAGCLFINQPLAAATSFAEPAEAQGQRLAEQLDCQDDSLTCLRSATDSEVLQALQEESFQPNVDGIFIPSPIGTMMENGDFNQVPITAGITANEGSLFVRMMEISSQAELENTLLEWSPFWGITDTERLLSLYHSDDYADAQEAFDLFYGDLGFVCPTKYFLDIASAYVDTRAYVHSHVPSWNDFYGLTGWGAYHSSELGFVFGTYLDGMTAAEQALSTYMRSAWTSTARLSATVEGVGDWPLYASESDAGGSWVDWRATPGTTTGVRKEHCDFIASQWFGE